MKSRNPISRFILSNSRQVVQNPTPQSTKPCATNNKSRKINRSNMQSGEENLKDVSLMKAIQVLSLGLSHIVEILAREL